MDKDVRKVSVLIVDDVGLVRQAVKEVLDGCQFENFELQVETAGSIHEANEQMSKSRFNCVVLDIRLTGEKMSGIDLGKMYRRLDPLATLISWTDFPEEFYKALVDTGVFDACVVKSDLASLQYAIVNSVYRKNMSYEEKIQEFMVLENIIHCEKAVELRASMGKRTAWRLEGTTADDKECLAWNLYVPGNNRVTIGLTCSVGCIGGCKFCLSRERPFKRPLSAEEEVAQFVHALHSPLALGVLQGRKKAKVNATCEGDVMSNKKTLDNYCAAVRMFSNIKLNLSFVVTTTGNVEGIQRLMEEYGDLDITIYLSENFRDDGMRKFYMPGVRDSMISIRDALQLHSEKKGKKDTISRMIVKGVNDTQEDAIYMKELFGGRPFKIKLMAMEPKSLENVEDTTAEDVENFRKRLLDVGFNEPDIRIKRIVGGDRKEGAGCGTTVPRDIKTYNEEGGEEDD